MQIAGFGLAGVLLFWLDPYEVFLVAAVLRAVAAAVGWFGLSERPARTTTRTTVGRTLRVNRELWTDPGRRSLLLTLWLPGGLVVGCEALFVPYAGDRAGFLYAAAALGMLAGDIVVGDSVPAWRTGWSRPAAAARPALPGLRAVAGAAAGHAAESSAQ